MTVRALPASFTSAQAVAYSPYRTSNRDSETITKDMIAQDLVLLGKAGIGLIRLFGFDDISYIFFGIEITIVGNCFFTPNITPQAVK